MAEPFLTVSGLTRRFDVSKPWLNRVLEREDRQFLTAAADVSFAIEKGETFALVGESGSGKSTIAKMIVGLLTPSAGRIAIEGQAIDPNDPATMRVLRRRMQMIFQDPFASLNPRWRVGDIIAEPIRTLGLMSGNDIAPEVARLLGLVGLSAKDADKFPHEFSGGQRQRIAIARALSSRPDFIVCDEPTSALDVSVQAQILNLMVRLQKELDLTYILISHNLSVVRHMSDQLAIMYLGRIVEIGDADTIFNAPLHPYTRLLLDTIPDVESPNRARAPLSGEVPSPINPPPGCAFHPRCPMAEAACSRTTPELMPRPSRSVACLVLESSEGAAAAQISHSTPSG